MSRVTLHVPPGGFPGGNQCPAFGMLLLDCGSWENAKCFPNCADIVYAQALAMTVDTFQREIDAAVRNYDRYVVCLNKSPEDFAASLVSLLQKAIRAFNTRPAGMRHGIALDKEVTIILSQSDEERPLCGIYFNLHSPYRRDALSTTVQPLAEKSPKPGI